MQEKTLFKQYIFFISLHPLIRILVIRNNTERSFTERFFKESLFNGVLNRTKLRKLCKRRVYVANLIEYLSIRMH